jgi:hypothetical protein
MKVCALPAIKTTTFLSIHGHDSAVMQLPPCQSAYIV